MADFVFGQVFHSGWKPPTFCAKFARNFSPPMPDSSPLRLFIIYAREDQPALLELRAHLRPLEQRGDLTRRRDTARRRLGGGLKAADIVLLLISSSFFTSDYIEKEELKKALERHQKGEAMVVPVIVKPCYWEAHDEIAALQVLPKDGKAVVSWGDADEAWVDVVRGVQKLVFFYNEVRLIYHNVEEALRLCGLGQYQSAFRLLAPFAKEQFSIDMSLNPHAYNLIGWMFQHGYCVDKNAEASVRWFSKAAELGDAAGQNNLGWMYTHGIGVRQNLVEAAKWYRKSAEQGDPAGQNNFGEMCEDGKGIRKDISAAITWYRKAAAQGVDAAKDNLNRLGYSE
jgi:hypothetical protein